MKTDMPEVIYAARYNNELTIHVSADPLYNGVRYIIADKHEELKAIADKMAEALEQMVEVFGNDASASTKKSLKVLTEYNKYKGE